MIVTYKGESSPPYEQGKTYDVRIQSFTGRIYAPGKTEDGKWKDKLGVQDTRLMLYMGQRDSGYRVYNTPEDLLLDFEVSKQNKLALLHERLRPFVTL